MFQRPQIIIPLQSHPKGFMQTWHHYSIGTWRASMRYVQHWQLLLQALYEIASSSVTHTHYARGRPLVGHRCYNRCTNAWFFIKLKSHSVVQPELSCSREGSNIEQSLLKLSLFKFFFLHLIQLQPLHLIYLPEERLPRGSLWSIVGLASVVIASICRTCRPDMLQRIFGVCSTFSYTCPGRSFQHQLVTHPQPHIGIYATLQTCCKRLAGIQLVAAPDALRWNSPRSWKTCNARLGMVRE